VLLLTCGAVALVPEMLTAVFVLVNVLLLIVGPASEMLILLD